MGNYAYQLRSTDPEPLCCEAVAIHSGGEIMDISYHKAWSAQLGRDMEYKRYGFAGRPFVVFPTSQGRFFQFEDSGGVRSLAEFVDTGRIQIFTVDGIDPESFFNKGTDHAGRIARHEAYFRYIRNEALPEINHAAQQLPMAVAALCRFLAAARWVRSILQTSFSGSPNRHRA
jgi:esterase/lipase superfamily enzyme